MQTLRLCSGIFDYEAIIAMLIHVISKYIMSYVSGRIP